MVEPRRRFRFIKELAEGAFGKVYVAEMITAEGFSSVVAIKLLHGKWAGHQEIAQRSRDEARLLGLLHHRNIVRVEDLTSINGQCAVVMEYLEGVDLKTLIAWCRDSGTRLPRRAAFEITSAIAGALDSAYNQVPMRGGAPLQVIHRDIKPSNVMVTAPGEVKVLDFGTARANFEEREARTQALAFGSQAYMAPERLLGDPDLPAGDVFSLGVNLYEMLTYQTFGKIYIRAERYDNALEERMAAVDLSDLPEDSADLVRDVLRRMLSYDHAQRPSAGEVVDLMDNLADAVNDGGLQRFCRQVVRQCLETFQPVQNPNDPLTGSTLFEDRDSGPRSIVPTDDVLPPAEEIEDEGPIPDVPPSEQEWEPHAQEPASAEPTPVQHAWRPPALEPVAEPTEEPAAEELPAQDVPSAADLPDDDDALEPPQAWQPPAEPAPEPVAEAPAPEPPPYQPPPYQPPTPAQRPVTVTPASPPAVAPRPPVPEPRPSGGGRLKVVVGVVLGLLLVGGGVVTALVISSGDDKTEGPTTTPPEPAAKLPPGGRREIAPMSASLATVKLTLSEPSAVILNAPGSTFKQEWDGTGTLELVGISPGPYLARITRGGSTVRAALKIDAGTTCSFKFDTAHGTEWEATGCE